MNPVELVAGDITTASVDAIVNAANPMMLGGGGVDGAIHRAAGPALLDACRQVPSNNGIRCPVGEARITPAGNLQARHVIHTVGPRYRVDPNPAALLESAYRNSLGLALSHDCGSVAFPAISCGAYGYPADEAAMIAVTACRQEQFRRLSIRFYLIGQALMDSWQRALDSSDTP